MTTTERLSPRGLRDFFAAGNARRHTVAAIEATEDIEKYLRQILLAEDPDAREALTCIAQARDFLSKALAAIDGSKRAAKRR